MDGEGARNFAAISSAEGPFGPGLRRVAEEEKSGEYLRLINALWNFNSVAGLSRAATFSIRPRFTNNVVSSSAKRSREVRFGARCLDRLLMSN